MDCGYEIYGTQAGFSAYTPYSLPSEPVTRRQALSAQRLAKITRYVEAHLDDPDLSAHTAARALGMSVRSLHLALASSSHSFGELVQRRRLELCRALLADWDRADSIADLAFACGFNSLSSFYRAFREYFGTCPRAVRAG
jgi:AraC-like DNA-binding protein